MVTEHTAGRDTVHTQAAEQALGTFLSLKAGPKLYKEPMAAVWSYLNGWDFFIGWEWWRLHWGELAPLGTRCRISSRPPINKENE